MENSEIKYEAWQVFADTEPARLWGVFDTFEEAENKCEEEMREDPNDYNDNQYRVMEVKKRWVGHIFRGGHD